ncbi:MAG: hypothetical protein QOD89_2680 [Bradyrhizobium sp.]|nr:hypothetical protein [Bradyrhizobium sp.]
MVSCPMRGRFLEAILQRTERKLAGPGYPGAADRLVAKVERREVPRPTSLGARGALPREVGTLIPPQGVPAGALAPPAAPPPRLGSRGTGKPRTHCAARMRNHVRHSAALAQRANPESQTFGSAAQPLDSGFAPRGAPRNDGYWVAALISLIASSLSHSAGPAMVPSSQPWGSISTEVGMPSARPMLLRS